MAEFFDSKQILHLVTGDRRPEEVYQDFSAVFHSILNQLESDKEAKEDKKLELADKSVVWVVGGPGSKKYERVEKILQDHPNWTVINTGEPLIIISSSSIFIFTARNSVVGLPGEDRRECWCWEWQY